jgi:hypothetical protein
MKPTNATVTQGGRIVAWSIHLTVIPLAANDSKVSP